MGLLDWLLKPFRGRGEPEPTPAPAEPREARPTTRAGEPPSAAEERARDREKAKAKARKKQRKAKARPPEPPKAERPKPAPKPKAEAAPPRDPRSEVLTVEEAERRFKGIVAKPIPEPSAEEEAAPEPIAEAASAVTQASPELEEAPPPRLGPNRRQEAAAQRQKARLPRFEGVLSRANALLAVPEAELRHLRSARRALVEDWEELGPPPAEDADRLAVAHAELVGRFDERIAAAEAQVDAARQENVARKQAILDEAIAHAERGELKGAGPRMGEIRARFRAVGPVPADAGAELDARFAEAEATLRRRQEATREARETERREALERLDRLVASAEALGSAKDPEVAADRVKELQAQWKAIRVPGARAEADVLWTRFRAACDRVFARRTEAREEAARVTLERMERIVVRAEALAASDEVGDPDEAIGKLITEWKRAGRAPREARDRLWERLQQAFDQLRNPGIELPRDEDAGLQFRPFAGLKDEEPE